MLPCLHHPSASYEKILCSHMMHEAKLVIVETLCFLGGKPARVDTVEDWSFSLLFTCLIIICMMLALFTLVCRRSNHGACSFLRAFIPCSASADQADTKHALRQQRSVRPSEKSFSQGRLVSPALAIRLSPTKSRDRKTRDQLCLRSDFRKTPPRRNNVASPPPFPTPNHSCT